MDGSRKTCVPKSSNFFQEKQNFHQEELKTSDLKTDQLDTLYCSTIDKQDAFKEESQQTRIF